MFRLEFFILNKLKAHSILLMIAFFYGRRNKNYWEKSLKIEIEKNSKSFIVDFVIICHR